MKLPTGVERSALFWGLEPGLRPSVIPADIYAVRIIAFVRPDLMHTDGRHLFLWHTDERATFPGSAGLPV